MKSRYDATEMVIEVFNTLHGRVWRCLAVDWKKFGCACKCIEMCIYIYNICIAVIST